MEWKKKNKKIEYFVLSLFKSFNGRNRKFIILIWKFIWEEIECAVGFTHSSQIPQTLQFLYPQIWEELEEIKLDLYNFFIKTSKILLYSLATCPHTGPAYSRSSVGSKRNNQAWVSTRNQANQLNT